MKVQKETAKKTEMGFLGDLESIRRELTRSCKNNQDLEVTNSELKEEVCGIAYKERDLFARTYSIVRF